MKKVHNCPLARLPCLRERCRRCDNLSRLFSLSLSLFYNYMGIVSNPGISTMFSGFVIIDVSRKKSFVSKRARTTCQIPRIIIMDSNSAILILYTCHEYFSNFTSNFKSVSNSLIILDFDNSDNFFIISVKYR